MTTITYKSRSSELRPLLKTFKRHFDNLPHLKRYEPALRRLVFLHTPEHILEWRGEGLHRLALMYEAEGRYDKADQHYQMSLEAFKDNDLQGRARTLRDYGLMLAQTSSPALGIEKIEEALDLHALDTMNAKGRRQHLITQSYLWRALLLRDRNDTEALDSLVKFALQRSQDCGLRDQECAITFAIDYAPPGIVRQLLVARLIEINVRRRKPVRMLRSTAQLALEAEATIIRALVMRPFRKE